MEGLLYSGECNRLCQVVEKEQRTIQKTELVFVLTEQDRDGVLSGQTVESLPTLGYLLSIVGYT